MSSDYLHQLIHSLSRTEKAYFKKYHHKNGAKNNELYFNIFDTINKQETYDEQKLLKKIKAKKNNKQLSASKNYLYQSILSCISDYHYNKSIDAQLYRNLEQIQILNNKGLYDHALKIVYKSQKLAESYERFLVLLKLQEWESQLLHYAGRFEDLQEFMEKGLALEEDYLQQWKQYRQIQQKVVQYFISNREYALVRTEEQRQQAIAKVQELERYDEEIRLSNRAAFLLYFGLFYHYYFAERDYSKADIYSSKRLRFFEEHPQFIEVHRYSYIHALNIVLITKEATGQSAAFDQHLAALQQLETQTQEEALGKLEVYVQNLLNHCLRNGQKDLRVDAAIDKIRQFETSLKEDFRISIHFQLSRYFSLHGHWAEALDWIEQMEALAPKLHYIDYQIAARILKMIYHYEMGDIAYLDYLANSTNYFSHKQGRKFETESTFIWFFKKIQQLALLDDPSALLQELKTRLLDLQASEQEEPLLDLLAPLEWVESRLRGCSIGEVVQG